VTTSDPFLNTPVARSGQALLVAVSRLARELAALGDDSISAQLMEAIETSLEKRAAAFDAREPEERARFLSQASYQCMAVRTLLHLAPRVLSVDMERIAPVERLAEADWQLIADLRAANDQLLGPRIEVNVIGEILPGTMSDDEDR